MKNAAETENYHGPPMRKPMINQLSNWRSLALVLLLGLTTAVAAQKPLNVGIVSPNTKTNLKIEQAIAGMNSPEEAKLVNQAVNLGCRVRSRITAFRALGSWSDGAEPSVLFRVRGDEESLRYILSQMGRDAGQKYVIYFHPQPQGPVDLYVLRPRAGAKNLISLSKELESAGIPFMTLVPSRNTTEIYIIDLDRDLREKILAAARKLRAQVNKESGSAKLFGDDLREKAKEKFDQEIKNYETKNPNLPPTCDAQKRKPKRGATGPTVGAALRGRPARNSILCQHERTRNWLARASISPIARNGIPRRAATEGRPYSTSRV